jgi:hypothetical protein
VGRNLILLAQKQNKEKGVICDKAKSEDFQIISVSSGSKDQDRGVKTQG